MRDALKKLLLIFRSDRKPRLERKSSRTQAQVKPSRADRSGHESTIGISGSVSHGLFVLHPPPGLSDDICSLTVDIVAVHGLNGKARDTWKDEVSGMLWLEDFLPEVLPHARIMTFGYDSSLLLSHSKGRIEHFAIDLLNRLWMLRQSPESRNRPLVFIAHSLGGIVVKKALILAHEDSRHYGDILSSTIGIVFMGTPHQGSNIVDWTSFLRNAIQIMSGTNILRTDLVQELSTCSPTLLEISKSFLPRSVDLTIMSFIETQSEPPLTVLVVPLESARLGLPNEMVFPVNTHHRNICRYPSAEDQTYALVEASIKSIISSEIKTSPARTAAKITTKIREGSEDPVNTAHSLAVTQPNVSFVPTPPTSVLVVSATPNSASGVAGPPSHVPKAPTLEHPKQKEDRGGEAMVALTDTVHESDMTTLRISGLKPRISATERGWDETTIELDVPSSTPFGELQSLLKDRAPDITTPHAFKFPGRSSYILDEWFDCFTVPVKIIKGRPCYKQSLGLSINANQSIASFLSKIFPDPMNAKIREYPKWMRDSTGLSHSVAVGQDDFSSLQIFFMRTVRVHGGKKSYMPPSGLGTFPLHDTQRYRDQLPPQAAAQGGLFLPMHESEAMYLAFDCQATERFAVRPFIGGVNGISGTRLCPTKSSELRKQDYIVVPEQSRLDGISIKPGVVKQFVAMKMSPEPKKEVANAHMGAGQGLESCEVSELGKGATVEWQMTGKDEVGGIQLQIIPQFRVVRMFAGSMKDACPAEYGGALRSYQAVPDDSVVYDVLKTPEELGLSEGDYIHVKEMANRKGTRRKEIADLVAEAPSPSDILDLEIFHNPSYKRIVTVRGANTNNESLRFRIDGDDDFRDIRAAARDAFGMPDAGLFIPGLVANNPDILFPINNWSDYIFATEPVFSDNEFQKPRRIDHLRLGGGGVSGTREVDLVLAPSTDKWRKVCHLDFLNGVDKHFANLAKPLMLEISHDSTIADVRHLIQETTGLSTEGFRVVSPKSINIADNCTVFGNHEVFEDFSGDCQLHSDTFPIVALAIDYDVHVYIKTLTGKTIQLPIRIEDTVNTIKYRIQDVEGTPPDRIRLLCVGKQLKDKHTLQDCGIKLPATLFLTLQLRGGGGATTEVKLGGTIIFDGHVGTVGELKEILFEQLGIFPHQQDLGHPNDFSLIGIGLTLKLSIVSLEREPLGLGAGGSIVQEILADPYDPRIWDVGGSKILYVHIVNSRDFKDITGSPPPNKPVTWRQYAQLKPPLAWTGGGQQQQQQGRRTQDVKGKGVSSDGMFDNLVSLEEEDYTDSERQHKGSYGTQKVPEYRLVLLEPDQTVPWFEALGKV